MPHKPFKKASQNLLKITENRRQHGEKFGGKEFLSCKN